MTLRSYSEKLSSKDLEERLNGWYAAYTGRSDDTTPVAYFRNEYHAKIFLLTYGKGKRVEKLKIEKGDLRGFGK